MSGLKLAREGDTHPSVILLLHLVNVCAAIQEVFHCGAKSWLPLLRAQPWCPEWRGSVDAVRVARAREKLSLEASENPVASPQSR